MVEATRAVMRLEPPCVVLALLFVVLGLRTASLTLICRVSCAPRPPLLDPKFLLCQCDENDIQMVLDSGLKPIWCSTGSAGARW